MGNIRNKIKRTLKKVGEKGAASRELFRLTMLQKRQKEAFFAELNALKRDGEAIEKNGRWYLQPTAHTFSAKIVKVTATFGFAQPLANEENEVFIPGRLLMGALPGDLVMLRPIPGKGDLPTAEVTELLAQADYVFTGVVRQEDAGLVVVSDKDRFSYPIVSKQGVRAKAGSKVLARICVRGKSHFAHKAEILQNFGTAACAKNSCDAILAGNGIAVTFPEPVTAEAERQNAAGISDAEKESRLDLRDRIIFTIDSADTKDIDDAVSVEKTKQGWELGVHIADVSHYVTEGSALDAEAFARGTSIYFADRVIPMLPRALSNGICSLNEGEDRLAFSVFLQIDRTGNPVGYHFQKTLIRSAVKGVYAEINQIYEGTASQAIRRKYKKVMPMLRQMRSLADCLFQRRQEKGVLDLSSVETKILLNEEGKAIALQPRESGISERMIEEFMLQANCAAADFSIAHSLPFLYRIHEQPSPEKLDTLHELLERLGLDASRVKPGVTSAELSEILHSVQGTPLESVVNNQILRSMAKARYSETNIGHYGLVADRYSHFTSPIRRYPDLAIHRIMSAYLKERDGALHTAHFVDFAAAAAKQSTEREITAMTVERDCEDCYKAEYLQEHLGEVFDGVISSVKPFGVYVELENTAEGLIRVERLPNDAYAYDGLLSLHGTYRDTKFSVGDPIRIRVAAADVSAGKVDFDWVPPDTAQK